MRIRVHAEGFDLTRHIRGFAEARVRSALDRFEGCIKSVSVHLEAVKARAQPGATRCSIVVALRPSGEVRSLASHAWMNVVINQASVEAGARVKDEVQRRRLAVAPSHVVGDRSHGRAPERVLDDKSISHRQRARLERPQSKRVRVRERWKPPAAGSGDAAGASRSRQTDPHGESVPRRRRSRPLSRVH